MLHTGQVPKSGVGGRASLTPDKPSGLPQSMAELSWQTSLGRSRPLQDSARAYTLTVMGSS